MTDYHSDILANKSTSMHPLANLCIDILEAPYVVKNSFLNRNNLWKDPKFISEEEVERMFVKKEYCVGKGSFSTVTCSYYGRLDYYLALKQIKVDFRYKQRELDILKKLKHPNLARLCFYSYDGGSGPENPENVSLYMELMPENLENYYHRKFKRYSLRMQSPNFIQTLIISFQLIKAVAYLHSINICHRDLKPSNILWHEKIQLLKLCDFGSAKEMLISDRQNKKEFNVSYIVSRWYRAPELLHGSTQYDFSVDIWSLGCLLVEIMFGVPLFKGKSSISQLCLIIQGIGCPTQSDMIAMNPNYKNFTYDLDSNPKRSVKDVIKIEIIEELKNRYFAHCKDIITDKFLLDFDVDLFCDLIDKTIRYNPTERCTAVQMLEHEIFKKYLGKLPHRLGTNLFSWTNEELGYLPSRVLSINASSF